MQLLCPQPAFLDLVGTAVLPCAAEIDASVAEELLSLLERAPPPTHRPKPSPRNDGGIGDGGGGGARPPGGGTLGGPPALVGQGLMGMADPSMLMVRCGFSEAAAAAAAMSPRAALRKECSSACLSLLRPAASAPPPAAPPPF
jgi:hypothetical protein